MRRALATAVILALFALPSCSGDDEPGSSTLPTPAATGSPTIAGSPDSPVPAAVYRATTPCDAVTRPVPTMAPGAECEMATWRVELGVDGRYTLDAAYGMSQPNTTGMRDGGTKVHLAGDYAAENGVIRLSTDDPAVTVRFLRVGADVLHLLGPDDALVVGNAGWSYTLNRDGKAGRHTPLVTPVFEEPGSPGGGVFEGRTPCTEEVRPFTAGLVPGCSKLKWRLTLRQNAAGKPAGYVSGVVGRQDASEGTWRIETGLAGFPDAVVYELSPAGASGRLSLLLVGGRHLFMLAPGHGDTSAGPKRVLLVGDELWSYTLSRTE
jgi:hypothetical protein